MVQTKKMRIIRLITILTYCVLLRLLSIPLEAFLVTESNFDLQLYDNIETIITQVGIIIALGLVLTVITYFLVSNEFQNDIKSIEAIRTCSHEQKSLENIFKQFDVCMKCRGLFFSYKDSKTQETLFTDNQSLARVGMYLILFSIPYFFIDLIIQDIFVVPSVYFLIFDLFTIPAIFLALFYFTRQLSIEFSEFLYFLVFFS
jgi:hypothetical protein